MSPKPHKLSLKRDEKLEITWEDGLKSVYPISLLRAQCPCASCKESRIERKKNPLKLNILAGNQATALHVIKAELVGNYALQIEWSDDHSAGIYSFEYLRGLVES